VDNNKPFIFKTPAYAEMCHKKRKHSSGDPPELAHGKKDSLVLPA
jgi:hypothetical protein